jgi:hypothetical protein
VAVNHTEAAALKEVPAEKLNTLRFLKEIDPSGFFRGDFFVDFYKPFFKQKKPPLEATVFQY